MAIVNAGLSLMYLGLLLATLVLQVFWGGRVSGHRIAGAIVVYLLLGVVWAKLYQMAALTLPQGFRFSEELAGSRPDTLLHQLTYFSFITLTTTGYGDIVPVHQVTPACWPCSKLFHRLYLAITLARLVSLEVMHRQEKP